MKTYIVEFPASVKAVGQDVLYAKKSKSALRSIRLFCGECMGMDRRYKNVAIPSRDIAECTDPMCPLFEWRFGRNPNPSKKKVEIGRKLFESQRCIRAETDENRRSEPDA